MRSASGPAAAEGGLILHVLLHVLPGLAALAMAALVVLRMGTPRLKTVMTAVVVCWVAATLGQVTTGHLTAPLIAADVAFSFWLLWFAWRGSTWWIWVILALQAARLLLHAMVYGAAAGVPYAAIYDTLSLAGLTVLALAAVADGRRRRMEG